MIPETLTPSRLVLASERPPVRVEAPHVPSHRRELYAWWQLGLLLLLVGWGRVTGRSSAAGYGRRVRAFCERMGTLWIRAGQLLALRSDLLSAEFCAELAQLRDEAPAVPFAFVRRTLEEELGAPIEQYFIEFDETPIQATTISQIHPARLRQDNTEVAVRVQHPYARATCARDARLIRRVVRLLERLAVYPNMRWGELRVELDLLMVRELDYRYEAAAARELRRKLRPHGVYVHAVHSRYCTPRLLVTEFVRGALMSDVVRLHATDPARLERWFAANDIDPALLARRLFRSVFRQVFEDNFFHADMHPENIILLRGSRFSVLDCRAVSELEKESLVRHRMLFEALAVGEYATAADLYFLLATRLPAVDIADVRAELVRVWRAWETRACIRELPYDERSLGYMFDGVNDVTFRHRFSSRWSLALLARTWANLDLSIRELDPDLNALKTMRTYFGKAARRRERRTAAELPRTAARSLIVARDLPRRVAELEHFRSAIFRRQAQVFRGTTTTVADLFAGCVGFGGRGVLLAALFVGLVLLDRHGGVPVEGALGVQLGGLVAAAPDMAAWLWALTLGGLLWLYRIARTLRRQLGQTDVRIPDAPVVV